MTIREKIVEDMEVVDRDGDVVGIVDRVDGHRIRLKPGNFPVESNCASYILVAHVVAVEGGTVRLSSDRRCVVKSAD